MNRLELKIIRDVKIRWHCYGGILAAHVPASEQPTYHFLVDLGILEFVEKQGRMKGYALTDHGWHAIPKNFQAIIKLQIEKKQKKARARKRAQHIEDYTRERQLPWYHTIDNHRFCRMCFTTTKNSICHVCNSNTFPLDVRARVPKKGASKKKWRNFLTKFQPEVLFKNPNWWKIRKGLIC